MAAVAAEAQPPPVTPPRSRRRTHIAPLQHEGGGAAAALLGKLELASRQQRPLSPAGARVDHLETEAAGAEVDRRADRQLSGASQLDRPLCTRQLHEGGAR